MSGPGFSLGTGPSRLTSSSIRRRAPSTSPRRTKSITSESTILYHSAVRAGVSGTRSASPGRSSPNSSHSRASARPTSRAMRCRRRTASAGLLPAVETATVMSPLRCTAGAMKLQCSRSSTALSGTPSCSASAQTAPFVPRSSVAAIASHAPLRSPLRYGRRLCSIALRRASAPSAGVTSVLTTVTCAPAPTSPCTFCSATAPPPITTARRPRRSRNTG